MKSLRMNEAPEKRPEDRVRAAKVRPAPEADEPLLFGENGSEPDHHLDAGDAHVPAETEGYYSSGSDDALGLYLKQMGSIPLLKRNEELDLAQRLETTRGRFRRAILFYAPVLGRVLDLF